MKNILLILLFSFSSLKIAAQTTDTVRYIKTPTGYLMVLRQGR